MRCKNWHRTQFVVHLRPVPLSSNDTEQLILFPEGFDLLAVDGSNGVGEAIGNLVRLAAEGGKASSASLYAVDFRANTLKPVVVLGLPESYVRGCGDVRIGDQCCGRAVEAKKPWIVADMLCDPLFATARAASADSGIRAAFSVPVLDADGNCIASLACHYREPFTPTNYDIERNEVFATLIASAIVSKRRKSRSIA
jgi:GAF domain-containing protein